MDETRVRLTSKNDYIHANWVNFTNHKKFILTQAPNNNTLNDFWQMIWETNSRLIVMLSSSKFIDDSNNTIPYYLTNNEYKKMFGNIKVIKLNIILTNSTIITFFNISNINENNSRRIEHQLFFKWPDKSIVKNTNDIITILQRIELETHPITIHCLAGIGRSGTLTTIFIAKHKIEADKKINILNIIDELRTYRYGAVEEDIQLVFIYFVLLKLAEKNDAISPYNKNFEEFEKKYNNFFFQINKYL